MILHLIPILAILAILYKLYLHEFMFDLFNYKGDEEIMQELDSKIDEANNTDELLGRDNRDNDMYDNIYWYEYETKG